MKTLEKNFIAKTVFRRSCVKITGKLWLLLSRTKRIALGKSTSMFFGELAPGEGSLDLALGVAMPLLATEVDAVIGSRRQAIDGEKVQVR